MADQQAISTAQTWTHRWTFVLAAAGSAIGLGNLWKFPYMAGMNGGGAFVIAYLVCIALIGIPIMMAETALGRHGRHSPINSMRELAREAEADRAWGLAGWVGAFSGFVILSFYSVIAGWAIAYTVDMFSGTFNGLTPEQVGQSFDNLTQDPVRMTFWHAVFMGLTAFIIVRGVHKGLESSVRIMMPGLFVLLLLLLGYSIMESGKFLEGVRFMFSFNLNDLTPEALLSAMGHSFFTLSVGMGAIMAYGAYMPKKASIARTIGAVAALDTAIALVAGLAIFPLVFAQGLEPSAGPGLLFVSLTTVFANIPGGQFIGGLFFLLVALAALSSSISLVEPVVAWTIERFPISRTSASVVYCLFVWLFGIGSILSFNEWSGEEYHMFGMTFFELMDYMTANISLPLGGFLIAIFASWVMKRSHIFKELNLSTAQFNLWRALCRVIAPAAVIVVFVSNITG